MSSLSAGGRAGALATSQVLTAPQVIVRRPRPTQGQDRNCDPKPNVVAGNQNSARPVKAAHISTVWPARLRRWRSSAVPTGGETAAVSPSDTRQRGAGGGPLWTPQNN